LNVLRVSDTGIDSLRTLFAPHGLDIKLVADGVDIPGSHWGDEEAGLITNTLFARADTPIHSVLHEACHWLLMSEPGSRLMQKTLCSICKPIVQDLHSDCSFNR